MVKFIRHYHETFCSVCRNQVVLFNQMTRKRRRRHHRWKVSVFRVSLVSFSFANELFSQIKVLVTKSANNFYLQSNKKWIICAVCKSRSLVRHNLSRHEKNMTTFICTFRLKSQTREIIRKDDKDRAITL